MDTVWKIRVTNYTRSNVFEFSMYNLHKYIMSVSGVLFGGLGEKLIKNLL